MDLRFDRRAFLDGVKTIAPLGIPGVPFGFVVGFIIQDEGLPTIAGWSTSWIIFAGSSQLAAINLLAEGASAVVIVVTVLLINSRHAMYSAALRSRFSVYPQWLRIVLPYFLIDQAFAVADTAPELADATPRYRMWHFLGTGTFMWTMWQTAIAAGIVVGDVIREEWALNFAVPILFLGLMMLSLKNKPAVVAAVVGAAVAVVARGLPQGSGLLLAIIVGVVAGGVAEIRLEGRTA